MIRILTPVLLAALAAPAIAQPIDRTGLRDERALIRDERRTLVVERCDPRGAQNCIEGRERLKETRPERLERREARREFRRAFRDN